MSPGISASTYDERLNDPFRADDGNASVDGAGDDAAARFVGDYGVDAKERLGRK